MRGRSEGRKEEGMALNTYEEKEKEEEKRVEYIQEKRRSEEGVIKQMRERRLKKGVGARSQGQIKRKIK